MRNQVESKSDNHGIKETTSTQTCRRGVDVEQAGPTSACGQKFRRDILGARSPSATTGPPAQGSSARKISPYKSWLQKLVRNESMEETSGAPSSSSIRTHTWTHLLRFTPSELYHRGSSLKGNTDIQGEGMEGTEALSLF